MGRKVVKSTAADPEELDSSIRRRRQQQQASCEKPCASPRGLLRGRRSLTKSSSTTTESPRRWSVFSSNSVSNNSNTNNNTVAISPRNSLQVSRQLDFSSPKSVTSKGAAGGGCAVQTQATTIMSPKKAASGLNGVVVCSPRESVVSSVGNSQRFSENGDADSMTSNYCAGGGGGAAAICIDELRQLESILHASGARLDELYRKVTVDSGSFKDHASVFDSLQWDILKEMGNIYKLVAATLLYCYSVIRHLEQQPRKCMCFGSRADGTWKLQIDSIISELKVLQDNLNFAMIAAVGNRIAQPLFSPPAVAPSKKPGLQEQQFNATVGLDEHVNYIIDFIKRPGVCLVGIHGQAGLGKTTLLNEIVAKVENSEKRLFAYIEMNDDLRILQSSLLLQLGGGKRDFQTTSLGRSAILYQLRKLKQQRKVVRIAIDNLSDVRLVGQLFPHSLGKVLPVDSSILITCPSVAIVNKIDQLCRRTMLSDYHYLPFKLPHLAPEHAKTLFVFHLATAAEVPANSILPVEDDGGMFSSSKYTELIDQFLPLCEGLPMALKVVGHYFSNSANCNEENWTAVAKRMKMAEDDMETTEDRMFAKLMVIFEKLGLAQKEAFLDIATFFRSWDWRIVERIVGKPQLEQLVNQGFVHSKLKDVENFTGIMQLTCYSGQPWKTEVVMMHDLLHAIACRRAHGNRVQSEDQAHLPDRLLMDNPGMELNQVQGLSLINCKEPLQGAMLEKMQDLRVLILQNIAIKGFCSKALNQLQFLYWGKTQVSREVRLPFQIGKLRKLEMMILCAHEIDLLMKFPPHLKDLTIIGCNNMEELPETLLVLSALVELHLVSCNRLLDLTPSFGSLKMLCRFRLENCLSIRYLPRCIGVLSSLHELDLSGCTNLTTLSSEIGKLVGLRKLNLSRCKSLVRLPAEIGCLRNLLSLNLGQLQIVNLPVEIGNLCALEDLSLSGCAQLEKLPKEIGHLASLLRLNLSSCTSLQELPKEIGKLISLQRLSLNSCSSLSRLPDQLYEIVTLQALDLDYCKSLTHLSPEIGNLCSLQRLSLNCCTRLTWLPTEITSLPCLQVINLVGCTGLKHKHPEEMEKITRQNSTTAYRDPGGLISLEGPKNRSFKLYSITY
ncbi:unnamed protein product [Sphagnum troendelagicum]|uniref:Disease resistance R13L4/SHOC-2-like LRR domain-containing protein n=1 Tax=Sphagnum troendelagicum TaxID=128251 RepID=A0ABP0TNB2_9BRYO